MKNVDMRAAILCWLHCWKDFKPVHFLTNFHTNEPFRNWIYRMTNGSPDDWYRFVTRPSGDYDGTDRALYTTFNGGPLVIGWNAQQMHECAGCSMHLPGLCFPRSRRHGPDEIVCYGCRYHEALSTRHSINFMTQYLSEKQSLLDVALAELGMSAENQTTVEDQTHQVVKALLNTKFNSICPFPLKHKQCPLREKCSLRRAHVRLLLFCN